MQKTFRLFVSSTFSDFTVERKLLHTKVFPKIKEICKENNLTFQPIDLRWGVTDEASNDQKTLELCLEEVQSSKITPYPNFLIMAGDRYGTVILPYAIERDEFKTLIDLVDNEDNKKLLNTWYILDENQIPASYILESRKGDSEKNKSHDGIDYTIRSNWKPVNTTLLNILQNAARNSNLSEAKKKKYFQSATEAEVIEGIFKFLDKTPKQIELLKKDPQAEKVDYENVYAYIRNIDSVDNEKLKLKFIDENANNVDKFKEEIRNSINKNNIYEENHKLNLTNVSKNENGSLEYYYEELSDTENNFADEMINFLEKSINDYAEELKKHEDEDLEKFEQTRFKESKLKDFLEGSRQTALNRIDEYINSNEDQALVIYGPSGIGKSSLMAKAIANAESKFIKTDTKVIYRFVGSTPNLTNTPEILISILKDLGITEEIRKVSNPQTLQEESEKLEEFYSRIHDHFKTLKQETIIFLDAIDQVNNEDKFLWLPYNLPSNVKFIISALDDDNYEKDSKYLKDLKNKSNNLYQLEEFDVNQGKGLILNILKRYDRTIQTNQMEYLLNIYEDIKTPLYLSVAAQELRHWKSTDKTILEDKDGQDLADTQKGIIEEFIKNLTDFYHHDEEFVKRVFSYLYLSDGLSESELIEVVSTDEEFISRIAPDKHHVKENKELPIVIWARLHSQIKEFLKLEDKDDQETMSFFHREFNDVIKNQEDIQQIHENLISLLQKLITEHQDEGFESNRWGLLYIEVVKDHHINFEFDWLIDENSKLKEYGEFLGKLHNENFQGHILYKILKFGYEFGEINKSKLENSFYKFCFYGTKLLYINNPSRWAEYYTSSLNNLAIFLKSIGQTSQAIELEQEALNIRKELYEENPSRWAEDYTRSLINLAISLKSIGQTSQAIELQQEALNILKVLYEENSSLWAEYYTTSLNNLAGSLKSIGQTSQAIELEQEALNIRKELYKENPSLWAEDYTKSLTNLATSFYSIGQTSQAIELQQEALNILKVLYEENSSLWVEDYTTSLNNLAYSLKSIGQTSQAIELEQEALNILKELYEENPSRWAEDYTRSLINLAASFYNIGQTSQAIELEQEALNITKELYEENPSRWVELYTSSLNNLAIFLKSIGQTSQAIELDQEALNILKELYEENPSRWAEDYRRSLNNLASSFYNIGQTSQAIELLQEALNIIKELYEENPSRWVELYTTSLDNLDFLLKSIGQTSQAIELEEKDLEIRKDLDQENPIQLLTNYSKNSVNLADLY